MLTLTRSRFVLLGLFCQRGQPKCLEAIAKLCEGAHGVFDFDGFAGSANDPNRPRKSFSFAGKLPILL